MADTNVLARFIGAQFFMIKTRHPFKNNVGVVPGAVTSRSSQQIKIVSKQSSEFYWLITGKSENLSRVTF